MDLMVTLAASSSWRYGDGFHGPGEGSINTIFRCERAVHYGVQELVMDD